ncbi:hypothetical protein P5673_001674, partial [Acropora cervicornis]
VLQRLQEACQESDWFFPWVAETSSIGGERVGTLYGHGDYDQIIILAPSSQQTPVFVDRVGGADFHNFDHKTLYERVKIMIEGLSLERERLSQWRLLRKEQEKNLQDIQEKERATTDEERRNVHVQNEDSPDEEPEEEKEEASSLLASEAHDSRRAVVVVLLNPSSHHNQSRSAMLRLCVVHEINLTTQTSLFTSPNAKTVGTLYGHGDYDQIIILAPSSQQTPVFVDRVGGYVYLNGGCYERNRRKTSKIFKRRKRATTDEERRNVHVQNEDSPDEEPKEEKEEASSLLASEVLCGSFVKLSNHAQDVSSKDEAHEQRKEEQNQKRKRRDKRSTAQRKKSKK